MSTLDPALPRLAATSRRDALVLAACQALYIAAISIDLTLTGLTGQQLAPVPALATLPFALITVAGAVVTWFAAQLIARIGRRRAFVLGAASGAAGGLVSVLAVMQQHFWLFCAGTAAVGVFQAFAQYYRLAAADAVPEALKARAVSRVMTGGVLAALAGPALAAWSRDWLSPSAFAGAYLMVALLGGLSVLLLAGLYRGGDAPVAAAAAPPPALPARPLREVMRQPVFCAAVANNVVAAMAMMFVMTAAPLAAVACGHAIDDGARIMQWHLVGMYGPAFFAGALIARWGLPRVLALGMALCALCCLVALGSASLRAFELALLLLGIGWNFMFVGGTTLLARSYRPAERARVQGAAELLRYAATAVATLAAGPVLQGVGWATLNAATLPLLVLAAGMTAWWVRAERRP
ncbi:MFS transporter [Aquincola tertiaricarbonis]|uniref:MFS transporter n=1 Tax=Aquincola tertiaricarbonis TaxID=391953 RepID=UPI000615007D|nr:MFS transporter [Aquincola tertiaricarbonis]